MIDFDCQSYRKKTVESALSRWRSIAASQFAKRTPSKFYGSFLGVHPSNPHSAYGAARIYTEHALYLVGDREPDFGMCLVALRPLMDPPCSEYVTSGSYYTHAWFT